MSKIIDNQLKAKDNLEHTNMIEVIQKYCNDSINFKMHIGSGFFFIDSLNLICDKINLKKLNYGDSKYKKKWNTSSPILIMLGKETNLNTKKALLDLNTFLLNSFNCYSPKEIKTMEYLLKKNFISFRVFTDKRFHAKIYFFYNNDILEDIYVGSANFTTAGLSMNIELTCPILSDKEIRKTHQKWFLNLWNQSTSDFNVLEVIKNYKELDFIYYTPKKFFENLIKILDKKYLFHETNNDESSVLVKFQNFDFYQVMKTLKKYNGCILASSVGLGKSYVALEVIKYFNKENKNTLLIGPSSLVKEGQWNEYLEQYHLNTDILGFGDLQQKNFSYNENKKYDLIIIDEAHNLRNKGTIQRDNIELLIEHNHNAKYLFITATPINTKISDLTNLIDLFYDVNKDTWLGKKIKDKYDSFKISVKKFEKSPNNNQDTYIEIQRLQDYIEQELIIKTTRNTIQKYFSEDLLKLSKSTKIIKPQIMQIEYTYNLEYLEKIFNEITDFLINLNFEYYKFRVDETKYKEDLNLVYSYKWLLYKRLESSLYSFYTSLKNLKLKNETYLNTLQDKTCLSSKLNKKDMKKLDYSKEIFDSCSKNLQNQIINNLNSDKILINDMIQNMQIFKDKTEFINDNKVKKLIDIFEENPDKKILIFTEYRDTLYYIYNILNKKYDITYIASQDINGSTIKQEEKTKIINKYKNNIKKHLISTDILSEGFNLPETDIIINFDLPYNPVKLIQRIGRATRINVQKELIVVNFKPDEKIDCELKLIDKLNIRISNIINMIGIDYNIWSNTEYELRKRENKDKINKQKILKEIKNKISKSNPEDLYTQKLSKETEIDILLKTAIKKYNLSIDEIPIKKPNKPIYTKLHSSKSKLYGLYNLNNDLIEYGTPELNIKEYNLKDKTYSKNEIKKLNENISKKLRENKYKRQDQTNNILDNQMKKKIGKIKKIATLKSIMQKILSEELYTNKQIELKILEIYDKINKNTFIELKEQTNIKNWKIDLNNLINTINEGNTFKTQNNNNIIAFIEYNEE